MAIRKSDFPDIPYDDFEACLGAIREDPKLAEKFKSYANRLESLQILKNELENRYKKQLKNYQSYEKSNLAKMRSMMNIALRGQSLGKKLNIL